MKKTPKHIDKEQLKFEEKKKDRRVQIFLGISTLTGPLLGVVAQFFLDLL